MDIERIAVMAARECIRQQVGVKELSGLIRAYDYANTHIRPNMRSVGVEDILTLGEMIEPRNGNGFRITPVTFQNGESSADSHDIPRLVSRLLNICNELDLPNSDEIDFVVKEFLWIHPFEDGNGRLGFILYNLLSNRMDYPYKLPNYFGE